MEGFNYVRKSLAGRTGNKVDLGQAGSFFEIKTDNSDPEEERIDGALFRSIHCMKTVSNYRIFTALKSDEAPSVLFIIWRDFPYLRHIEEGGDLMLQEFKKDAALKYLLVDNTFVKSGWMKDNVIEYLNHGWYPGLIEVGVEKFVHLQAKSALGANSFEEFEKDVNKAMGDLAKTMRKEPFKYYPVKTSEINDKGEQVDLNLRKLSLKAGLEILNK